MKASVFGCIMAIFATAATAQDVMQFRTADSNIHCLIMSGDFAVLRCDIFDFVPTFTIAPPDCDLDWEGSYLIAADGRRGELGCAGDTIAAPEARVIGDGETVSMWQFSCTANGSDLICVNLEGHGFSLSREKQALF